MNSFGNSYYLILLFIYPIFYAILSNTLLEGIYTAFFSARIYYDWYMLRFLFEPFTNCLIYSLLLFPLVSQDLVKMNELQNVFLYGENLYLHRRRLLENPQYQTNKSQYYDLNDSSKKQGNFANSLVSFVFISFEAPSLLQKNIVFKRKSVFLPQSPCVLERRL